MKICINCCCRQRTAWGFCCFRWLCLKWHCCLSVQSETIYSGGARAMKTVIKRTRFWETAVTIWYAWRRHFWCWRRQISWLSQRDLPYTCWCFQRALYWVRLQGYWPAGISKRRWLRPVFWLWRQELPASLENGFTMERRTVWCYPPHLLHFWNLCWQMHLLKESCISFTQKNWDCWHLRFWYARQYRQRCCRTGCQTVAWEQS